MPLAVKDDCLCSSRERGKMIKLCRVDSRLVHEQTVFSWYPTLEANAILVVSDEYAASKERIQALRIAKPADAKLVVKSVEDSIVALNGSAVDKYELIVVAGNVHDACEVARACPKITSVNLGGARPLGDSVKELGPAVRLSQSDINEIKKAMADGIEFEVRQVASEKKRIVTSFDL